MGNKIIMPPRESASTAIGLGLCPRLRVGGRNSQCIARMNQSRDSSSSSENISLDHLVDSLKEGKYKNVLVVAGAGVSCSAGIPDVSISV